MCLVSQSLAVDILRAAHPPSYQIAPSGTAKHAVLAGKMVVQALQRFQTQLSYWRCSAKFHVKQEHYLATERNLKYRRQAQT
jgi:hypothetical protein